MAWIRIEQTFIPPETRNQEGLVFSLIATPFVALLAMVATGILIDAYPYPVDDAVALGIAGSLFILLLVIALVVYFVVLGFRRSQGILAVKRSMAVLLVGLPAAAVVGVAPWLAHRLMVTMPWMAHFPWGIAILLLGLPFAYINRRKRREPKPVAPR
jgi:magnesium-transporting ATPase (P-type)